MTLYTSLLIFTCFCFNVILMSSLIVSRKISKAIDNKTYFDLTEWNLHRTLFSPSTVMVFYLIHALVLVVFKSHYQTGQYPEGYYLLGIIISMLISLASLTIVWSLPASKLTVQKFNSICISVNLVSSWSLMFYVAFVVTGIFGDHVYSDVG